MNEPNSSNRPQDELVEKNTGDQKSAAWRPLNAFQRRVVGVLIEKAKTTPDNYPLTVNSIVTASNQKSNRSPQMDIAADDTLLTLDELREMGVVVELHGSGRVERYRHKAYEWFGVDKVELAVLAELLLRGEQTVGELRGRASRMEPIADLGELRPVLERLIDKKLVVPITAAGRGQIVTHGVFPPAELEQIKREVQTTEIAQQANEQRQQANIPPTHSKADENEIAALKKHIELLTTRIETIERELGL